MSKTSNSEQSREATWLEFIQEFSSNTMTDLTEAGQKGIKIGTEALSSSTDTVLTVGQKGVDTTLGGSKAGWEQLKTLSTDAWDITNKFSNAALQETQQIPQRFSRLLFKDCTVPLFLLPTGGKPNDYVCHFDFAEVTTKLQSGILVCPKIEVWTGREDLNRQHLGMILQDEFTRQLHEQKKQLSNKTDWKTSLANFKNPLEDLGINGTQIAFRAVQLMLIATNPVADAVLLSLAIFGATGTAFIVLKKLLLSPQLQSAEEDLQRLEKELDSKSKIFQEAIENIDIQVHPVLCELTKAFAAATNENVFLPPHREPLSVGPDIAELLKTKRYRSQLPTNLHPVLDTILEGEQQNTFLPSTPPGQHILPLWADRSTTK